MFTATRTILLETSRPEKLNLALGLADKLLMERWMPKALAFVRPHFVLSLLALVGSGCTKGVTTLKDLRALASQVDGQALATNAPAALSNATTLNVTVSGLNVTKYKYKLGPAASTTCSDSSGYSASEIDLTTPITDALGADDSYRLCLIGLNTKGVWQSYSAATEVNWSKDTLAPNVTNLAITYPSFYTNVDYQTPSLQAFSADLAISDTVRVYTAGTCSSGSLVATGIATGNFASLVTSPLADGQTHNLYAQATDPAGNTGACTNLNTYSVDMSPRTVQWSLANQVQAESVGTVALNISLSMNSIQSVTVPFTIHGSSTLTSGTEHDLTAGTIVIAPGATTGSTSFVVTNDTLHEPAEMLSLDLGTPTNANLGAQTNHQVFISDSDAAPSVSFAAAGQSVGESAGAVSVSVSLSGPSGYAISVPWTQGGTASLADSSLPSTGTVNFAAGETAKTIDFSIVNDAIFESSETVVISFGAPSNASAGAQTTYTTTIVDDDALPDVSWTAAVQNPSESTGTVTLTAQLTSTYGSTVTVPFTVTGTALGAAVDHNLSDGTVTINPGNLTGSTSFSLTDDLVAEPAETIVITMGSPTNANQGATTVQTVTIDDEDPSPVQSTLMAGTSSLPLGSTTLVTLQAKDYDGNNITTGGATVSFAHSLGTFSAVTDVGDGTYTATFTATLVGGSASVSGLLNGSTVLSALPQIEVKNPALLTVAPANFDFGNVNTTQGSDSSFTISNTGQWQASSLNIVPPSSPFSIFSTTCGSTLNAGSSCNVTIRLLPISIGNFNSNFSLDYHNGTLAGQSTGNIGLVGNGVNSTPVITKTTCFKHAYKGETTNCWAFANNITNPGDTPNWIVDSPTCSGISINSATGAISILPNSVTPKICTFNLRVSDGFTTSSPWPVKYEVHSAEPGTGFNHVAVGEAHGCMLSNGRMRCWGRGVNLELGNNQSMSYKRPDLALEEFSSWSEVSAAQYLSAGNRGNCVRYPNGYLRCNGTGTAGENGDTFFANRWGLADHVVGLTNVVKPAAGNQHRCALLADPTLETNTGMIRCWGSKATRNMGNGSISGTTATPDPFVSYNPSPQVKHAIDLSAGFNHTCALMGDGGITCWGTNTSGQLGLGNLTIYNYAMPIPGWGSGASLKAVEISVGNQFSCAIERSGQVYCWGANSAGQLGQGNTTTATSPLPVDLGGSAVRISAGGTHACALLTTNQIKCWGSNTNGELGYGDTFARGDTALEMGAGLSVVQVGTGLTPTDVRVGTSFTCAQVAGGTHPVKCWGLGTQGQLGAGYPMGTLKIGDAPAEMGDSLKPVVWGRQIFVTFASPNGNIGGIAAADSICQSEAAGRLNSASYKAVLSSSTIDAIDRIGAFNEPLYNLSDGVGPGDDKLIANDSVSLWSGITSSIAYMADYTSGGLDYWTNTFSNGIKKSSALSNTCNDWTSTTGTSSYGRIGLSGSSWIDFSSTPCSSPLRLLCISGPQD